MVESRTLRSAAALSLVVAVVFSVASGAAPVERHRSSHTVQSLPQPLVYPTSTLQAIDDDSRSLATQSSDDGNSSAAAGPASSYRLHRPTGTAFLLPTGSNRLRPGHAWLWPLPRSPAA